MTDVRPFLVVLFTQAINRFCLKEDTALPKNEISKWSEGPRYVLEVIIGMTQVIISLA